MQVDTKIAYKSSLFVMYSKAWQGGDPRLELPKTLSGKVNYIVERGVIIHSLGYKFGRCFQQLIFPCLSIYT